MKNVAALTMVFTLGLLQIGANKATMRLQRKQQQQRQQFDNADDTTTSTLQCYVCENCPDNIDEHQEMAVLCGAMSSTVVSNGNGGAVSVVTTTIKPPEMSEEYGDYEEDEDYDENDEEDRKAIRTLTTTTVKTTTTSTEIPIVTTTTSVMPVILENALVNKIPVEDFNSYEYESDESEEETTKTTTTSAGPTTTSTTRTETSTTITTTTTPPIVENTSPPIDIENNSSEPPVDIESNSSDTDFDNYEYEEEDLKDYDRQRNGGKARQSNLNSNICYSIRLSNNKTAVTNRGCATLVRGNKALTCQSLSKGLPILACLVCDTNGCNSHSNQFSASPVKPSSSQGLKVNNIWMKLLPVAVLIVAILIRPQI